MLGLTRSRSAYKTDAVCATIMLLVVLVCFNVFAPFVSNATKKEESIGRAMVSEAQQWYEIAMQDQNLQIRAQHVAFANAYLHAARHVADDATLERLTKIDVHVLHKNIEMSQKSASKEITRKCPKLKDLPISPQKLS
tara:strand:+ start:288 stop:701 length:414 start_codon:yes stop_codon:yes gene_type:complete